MTSDETIEFVLYKWYGEIFDELNMQSFELVKAFTGFPNEGKSLIAFAGDYYDTYIKISGKSSVNNIVAIEKINHADITGKVIFLIGTSIDIKHAIKDIGQDINKCDDLNVFTIPSRSHKLERFFSDCRIRANLHDIVFSPFIVRDEYVLVKVGDIVSYCVHNDLEYVSAMRTSIAMLSLGFGGFRCCISDDPLFTTDMKLDKSSNNILVIFNRLQCFTGLMAFDLSVCGIIDELQINYAGSTNIDYAIKKDLCYEKDNVLARSVKGKLHDSYFSYVLAKAAEEGDVSTQHILPLLEDTKVSPEVTLVRLLFMKLMFSDGDSGSIERLIFEDRNIGPKFNIGFRDFFEKVKRQNKKRPHMKLKQFEEELCYKSLSYIHHVFYQHLDSYKNHEDPLTWFLVIPGGSTKGEISKLIKIGRLCRKRDRFMVVTSDVSRSHDIAERLLKC